MFCGTIKERQGQNVYNNFFGFKERPFQLVPNPGYLFLSRSHEEAMAHLNYALSHGDGFVEITGEVGTGKTTLCRAFLEDLDKDSEVAYIFNPRLNSLELLRAINDEFGISSDADNTKDLIDTLNTFLMEKKSKKKNAILLIDEAQNLSEDVLEQLRLLSNLETNTSKLLQIILVGQPELRDMLDSYKLRQLRQRITLSWYLTPLNRKETREYIRHRVNIASKKAGDIFTESAYRLIYKYSRGIPRLINIACDRALLTAYGLNQSKVTGSIAGSALKELRTGGENTPGSFLNRPALIGAVVLFLLVLSAAVLFKIPPISYLFHSKTTAPAADTKNTVNNPSQKETGKPGPAANTPNTPRTFEDFLGTLTGRSSRLSAAKTAMSLWNTERTPAFSRFLNNIDDDAGFFHLAAVQNNFHALAIDGELDLVKKLNLPAVLGFMPPGASTPRYLTLTQMTENEIILKGGENGKSISVKPEKMKSYWTGAVYIIWKDFYNCRGDIPLDAPKESVFTLKMLLRDIGYNDIALDHQYDESTMEAVREIQESHGIEVDGIVGARTKIVIYNKKKELKIPHIFSLNDAGGDKTEGARSTEN
jgi:general secretion pathway protein A